MRNKKKDNASTGRNNTSVRKKLSHNPERLKQVREQNKARRREEQKRWVQGKKPAN